MTTSQATTEPMTPEPFTAKIVNSEDATVFAELRPHNELAGLAFNDATNETIRENLTHQRRFLQPHRVVLQKSPYTEDEGDPGTREIWAGLFTFSLQNLPINPTVGWYAGTGRVGKNATANAEVDLLLAPPRERWTKRSIAGRHVRFHLDAQTNRMRLSACHSVVIGSGQAMTKMESTILNEKDIITIGMVSYVFDYTSYHKTANFADSLRQFFAKWHGPGISFNRNLSPASVGSPFTVGRYSISSTAFGRGSFGLVRAAWADDGVFAVKQLKRSSKTQIQSHKRLMGCIGKHSQDNIIHLIDVVEHADVSFLVYTPLALETLSDSLREDDIGLVEKVELFRDFLSGLSFLHSRGIMHRDIKPANLAIVSHHKPHGLILDLDAATQQQDSRDHMQGTIPYLAPEVIALKVHDVTRLNEVLPAYDNRVDIWAMGLAAWVLYAHESFRWSSFDSSELENQVSAMAHQGFRHQVALLPKGDGFPDWINCMTEWKPAERPTASSLFQTVSQYASNRLPETVSSSSKRKRSDTGS